MGLKSYSEIASHMLAEPKWNLSAFDSDVASMIAGDKSIAMTAKAMTSRYHNMLSAVYPDEPTPQNPQVEITTENIQKYIRNIESADTPPTAPQWRLRYDTLAMLDSHNPLPDSRVGLLTGVANLIINGASFDDAETKLGLHVNSLDSMVAMLGYDLHDRFPEMRTQVELAVRDEVSARRLDRNVINRKRLASQSRRLMTAQQWLMLNNQHMFGPLVTPAFKTENLNYVLDTLKVYLRGEYVNLETGEITWSPKGYHTTTNNYASYTLGAKPDTGMRIVNLAIGGDVGGRPVNVVIAGISNILQEFNTP